MGSLGGAEETKERVIHVGLWVGSDKIASII